MFNLFKKKRTTATVVAEIHNAFNVAGEKILREAKEIISELNVNNKDRVDSLSKFGFNNTKEVQFAEKINRKREEKERIATAIEQATQQYPLLKFITYGEVTNICNKYGLVVGDVKQYKGFVPDKNLNEIKAFFETESDLNTDYFRQYSSSWGSGQGLTREEYEREIKTARKYVDNDGYHRSDYYFYKKPKSLVIAAPIKDMDLTGHKLKENFLIREIPDPVVLCPIMSNNVQLYCIVTAWGDEASDPIVVNEKMN